MEEEQTEYVERLKTLQDQASEHPCTHTHQANGYSYVSRNCCDFLVLVVACRSRTMLLVIKRLNALRNAMYIANTTE